MNRLTLLLALAAALASCGKPAEDPKKKSGEGGYGPSEKDCVAWESVMAALAKERQSGALAPVPDFGAFLAKDAVSSKSVDAACARAGMPKERFLATSARLHKGLELKLKVDEGVDVSVGDGDPGFDLWVNYNWKRIAIFEEQLK